MTDDAPITPMTDTPAAADAEMAAAPTTTIIDDPVPQPEPTPVPDPTPVPPLTEMDALGLEVIGLKQRVELAERRLTYLGNLFAWPPGLE